jgi:hypothetical protein
VLRFCCCSAESKGRGSGLAAKLWIRQEEVETNGSLSAGRFFGVARERFRGTLADHEGSLLSAMMPISFRGANDDFQGG